MMPRWRPGANGAIRRWTDRRPLEPANSTVHACQGQTCRVFADSCWLQCLAGNQWDSKSSTQCAANGSSSDGLILRPQQNDGRHLRGLHRIRQLDAGKIPSLPRPASGRRDARASSCVPEIRTPSVDHRRWTGEVVRCPHQWRQLWDIVLAGYL